MMSLPVAEKPFDNTPRGRLRALYDWVTGTTPTPDPSPGPAKASPPETVPARIGHYAVARKLGEGGMGVVYEAGGERLERTVAVKTMSSVAKDETARKRFWREARAAARVNHPNVCHIYEIGEQGNELFIAMELLEGEALGDRLRRGPLSGAESGPIRPGMPTPPQALPPPGRPPRQLKPSHAFISPHAGHHPP